MNSYCFDIGYNSLYKHGEEICGDHIEVVRNGKDSIIMVLADGMGSGVKANILSTLTAKIISTMMEQSMSIEDCVNTIASTLPVNEKLKVAYSTFTIISITNSIDADIIQYDNPPVIWLHNGKNVEYPMNPITIGSKVIYHSKIKLNENDALVTISDGAIHASKYMELNLNWKRENIVDFLQVMYEPGFTAKTISTMLLDQCNKLYGNEPGDDTTACTIKIKKKKTVNLLIGPPNDPSDDAKMIGEFLKKRGKRIVCGGTTSTIVAEYLGENIVTNTLVIDPEIPPTAAIEGIDLVTEGALTISQVLEYAEDYLKDNEKYVDWAYKKDGASLVARMLFEEATDINFFVGMAVNPAHQNPDLPIDFSTKMHLIDMLSKKLNQMGKTTKIKYY